MATASIAELAIEGMKAICATIRSGARVGEVYRAWHEVAAAGLAHHYCHHCGYAWTEPTARRLVRASAQQANRLRTSGRQPVSRPPAPAHPDPSHTRACCRLGQEHDRDTVIRDPHSLASCITSHRNLHTPCILRHRFVPRIQSFSRCARQREQRLFRVRVIFTCCEEDAHAPNGPNSPASKGRESTLARDLCNIRVHPTPARQCWRLAHEPTRPPPLLRLTTPARTVNRWRRTTPKPAPFSTPSVRCGERGTSALAPTTNPTAITLPRPGYTATPSSTPIARLFFLFSRESRRRRCGSRAGLDTHSRHNGQAALLSVPSADSRLSAIRAISACSSRENE